MVIELYRNDYRRRWQYLCNCELYDCKSECGINSLDLIRREVICRALYTQHVTISMQTEMH
jgi:hypothetical protein